MSQDQTLGDRMKTYEVISRTELLPRIPKIIRLDGKAFHTFTKKFKQPFDKRIMDSMVKGAMAVMKEIGGIARFAYIQSDECTIVLNDSMSEMSQPWYGNQVQKMASVSAAIMSVNFSYEISDVEDNLAYFDSRVFALPNEMEMTNNIIWRQQDAIRNSVSQWARSMFSHKELQGKNVSQMQDMMKSKGFDWNTAINWTKSGVIVHKIPGVKDGERSQWVAEDDLPIFSKNREMLLKLYGKDVDDAPKSDEMVTH